MKNRHRVVWTKGMFLNPQHFQAQDQYFEEAQHFRFSASSYCNWGVAALDIDAESLANGLFRLNAANGILPDGLAFRMPNVDAIPPSREFAEIFETTARQLDVYLAIPEQQDEAANLTMPSGAAAEGPPATRYSADRISFTDVNTGSEQKEIQVARSNFRLLFGTEYRDGMVGIKIAQIVRDSSGGFALKQTYIAPCLDITHNKYVMGLLQRMLEILSTKSDSLSARRREGGKGLAEFNASDTASFWLLHTANSFLPELRHILKVRHSHPENAYLAMARLAGALATFSLDFSPGDLPHYDHNDLSASFTGLDERIRRLIDTVINEGYVSIPLEGGERDIWTAQIPEDRYFRDCEFFLAVTARMDAGEIIQKVPIRAKAASQDDIERIIKSALNGITLTHTPAPPAVRLKLGNQYFALGQVGELWQKVKQLRSLAVFAPADLRDAKFELIIVTGPGR